MNGEPVPKDTAIFPVASMPLRSLAIILAVMCYLASLAAGTLVVMRQTTDAWVQGLSSEVTIQLRPVAEMDEDKILAKLSSVATAAPGVKSAVIIGRAETTKLLEPWLGADVPPDLPIPRLIRVAVDEANPPDYAVLLAHLEAIAKTASLDTHQRWQSQFARLGLGLTALAGGVLVLIVMATATLVAYAARNVMNANQLVVEVLQMVGAEPKFISRQNDGQFLAIGLLSSCAGTVAAAATFALLGWLFQPSLLLYNMPSLLRLAAALLLVPIVATLLAVWVARFSLLRALGRQ